MAIKKITTSATFNIKQGVGQIRQISCSAPGTNWTLQINDGPDSSGNVQTIYGGTTPGTITSGLVLFTPLYFRDGIQIVTSGAAPGEIDVDYL